MPIEFNNNRIRGIYFNDEFVTQVNFDGKDLLYTREFDFKSQQNCDECIEILGRSFIYDRTDAANTGNVRITSTSQMDIDDAGYSIMKYYPVLNFDNTNVRIYNNPTQFFIRTFGGIIGTRVDTGAGSFDYDDPLVLQGDRCLIKYSIRPKWGYTINNSGGFIDIFHEFTNPYMEAPDLDFNISWDKNKKLYIVKCRDEIVQQDIYAPRLEQQSFDIQVHYGVRLIIVKDFKYTEFL